MGVAGERVGDSPLVHQLREVSAVVALSHDDARAGHAVAGRLRKRARARRGCHYDFRACAVLLLRGAYLSAPCARLAVCLADLRQCGVACWRSPASEARRLWPQPRRHLRDLVRDRAGALSVMPMVRSAQAAPPGLVVELSL